MDNHEIDWRDLSDESLGKMLESFDSHLLCSICQDFYENPQILKCGHSFCSLCLRRHFDVTLNRATNNLCPTCREKAELFDLRKNVVLSTIVIQYQELKKVLFTKLTTADHSSPSPSSSPALALMTGNNYHQIKGKAITSKVAHPHLHGATKEKVRKVIEELTKDSRIKLRIDGDKDVLERRLRELIHLMNAQVDSDHPLSLDAVISKVNDAEDAKRRTVNAEALVQTKSFKRSFTELSKRAIENSQRTKESQNKDSKQEQLSPELRDDEASNWRIVESSVTDRPFYYDVVNKRGQFTPPPALQPNTEGSPISYSSNEGEEDIEPKSVPADAGSSNHTSREEAPTPQLKHEEEDDSVIVIESTDNSSSMMTQMTQNPNHWECSFCTFINYLPGDTCEICRSKNGAKRPRRSERKSVSSQFTKLSV